MNMKWSLKKKEIYDNTYVPNAFIFYFIIKSRQYLTILSTYFVVDIWLFLRCMYYYNAIIILVDMHICRCMVQ